MPIGHIDYFLIDDTSTQSTSKPCLGHPTTWPMQVRALPVEQLRNLTAHARSLASSESVTLPLFGALSPMPCDHVTKTESSIVAMPSWCDVGRAKAHKPAIDWAAVDFLFFTQHMILASRLSSQYTRQAAGFPQAQHTERKASLAVASTKLLGWSQANITNSGVVAFVATVKKRHRVIVKKPALRCIFYRQEEIGIVIGGEQT